MIRTALWTLRQRRYRTTVALMLLIAIGCVVAGTWQIARYERTRRINSALRADAHAPAVALTPALVPLVGHGPAPGRDAIRFRTVDVTGSYASGAPQFLRNQSVGGESGFYVVNQFRTSTGTVLVARGFVASDDGSTVPSGVRTPPTGTVHLITRLDTADSRSDNAAALHGQLESINPAQQATRLGAPVYDAYLVLRAHQPGTGGLRAVPAPSLSNPAGGAGEGQHLAYIVQWYVFALLALGAPFAIARNELRDAQRRYLGIDPDVGGFDDDPAPTFTSIPSPTRAALGAGAGPTGELAERSAGGVLAARGGISEQQWQHAADLAARYGRAVSIDRTGVANRATRRSRPVRTWSDAPPTSADYAYQLPDSTQSPHRSHDAYHGSYNDYLWRLAMADGSIADADLGPATTDRSAAPGTVTPPQIIDANPTDTTTTD